MVPIVSLSNLAAFPFLLFISIRLFSSFRQVKSRSMGYFFGGMFSLMLVFIATATPGLLLKDPEQIAIVFAFYPSFIFLALAFWGAVPFNILNKRNLETAFLAVFITLAVAIAFINLGDVKEAIIYREPPFIYWEDTRGAIMNLFIGITTVLTLIYLSLFFLINGFRSIDRYVRERSLLIGWGLVIFIMGAVANFILGAGNHPFKYVGTTVSSLLAVISSIMIFVGIGQKENSLSGSESEQKVAIVKNFNDKFPN